MPEKEIMEHILISILIPFVLISSGEGMKPPQTKSTMIWMTEKSSRNNIFTAISH